MKIIYSVVNRKNIENVIKIVKEYYQKSFYYIRYIRYVSEILPSQAKKLYKKDLSRFLNGYVKENNFYKLSELNINK